MFKGNSYDQQLEKMSQTSRKYKNNLVRKLNNIVRKLNKNRLELDTVSGALARYNCGSLSLIVALGK